MHCKIGCHQYKYIFDLKIRWSLKYVEDMTQSHCWLLSEDILYNLIVLLYSLCVRVYSDILVLVACNTKQVVNPFQWLSKSKSPTTEMNHVWDTMAAMKKTLYTMLDSENDG